MIRLKKISGVYGIFNILNGKVYIGNSFDIKTRWRAHKWKLRNNEHHNRHLQNAWNKYGETSFEFKIIETTNRQSAPYREVFWISFYDSTKKGYNMTLGGEGGTPTEEVRIKISKAHKGRKHTAKARKNMSDSHKGKKLGHYSKEHCRKISEALTGRKLSPEHCKKISEIQIGKKRIFTEEHCANIRNGWTPERRKKASIAHSGENGFWYGKKMSPESRRKMSISAKNNWDKIPKEKRKFTPEHIAKISASNMGKKHSEDTLKKLRASSRKRWDRYKLLKAQKQEDL